MGNGVLIYSQVVVMYHKFKHIMYIQCNKYITSNLAGMPIILNFYWFWLIFIVKSNIDNNESYCISLIYGTMYIITEKNKYVGCTEPKLYLSKHDTLFKIAEASYTYPNMTLYSTWQKPGRLGRGFQTLEHWHISKSI